MLLSIIIVIIEIVHKVHKYCKLTVFCLTDNWKISRKRPIIKFIYCTQESKSQIACNSDAVVSVGDAKF